MNPYHAEAARQAKWFGPRLKELRAARGLSQAALAKKAGMAQSKIGEYESPTTAYLPSWETVLRLSFALGVAPAEFLIPPAAPDAGEKS